MKWSQSTVIWSKTSAFVRVSFSRPSCYPFFRCRRWCCGCVFFLSYSIQTLYCGWQGSVFNLVLFLAIFLSVCSMVCMMDDSPGRFRVPAGSSICDRQNVYMCVFMRWVVAIFGHLFFAFSRVLLVHCLKFFFFFIHWAKWREACFRFAAFLCLCLGLLEQHQALWRQNVSGLTDS